MTEIGARVHRRHCYTAIFKPQWKAIEIYNGGREDPVMSHGRELKGARPGSAALIAGAVGAVAVGAFAIGALAIGRLAIRSMRVGEGRIKSLEIGELTVKRLRVSELSVSESLELPPKDSGENLELK